LINFELKKIFLTKVTTINDKNPNRQT